MPDEAIKNEAVAADVVNEANKSNVTDEADKANKAYNITEPEKVGIKLN